MRLSRHSGRSSLNRHNWRFWSHEANPKSELERVHGSNARFANCGGSHEPQVVKAPKSKLQASEKLQAPTAKRRNSRQTICATSLRLARVHGPNGHLILEVRTAHEPANIQHSTSNIQSMLEWARGGCSVCLTGSGLVALGVGDVFELNSRTVMGCA